MSEAIEVDMNVEEPRLTSLEVEVGGMGGKIEKITTRANYDPNQVDDLIVKKETKSKLESENEKPAKRRKLDEENENQILKSEDELLKLDENDIKINLIDESMDTLIDSENISIKKEENISIKNEDNISIKKEENVSSVDETVPNVQTSDSDTAESKLVLDSIIGDKKDNDEVEILKVISPPKRPASEIDCGITEYVGKHSGFSAILKHRYSDFLVNEITPEGEVVKLTSFDLPKDSAPKIPKDTLKTILSEEIVDKIEKLASESQLEDVVIDADEFDKEKRTKLHGCIAENYQTLTSETETINGKKVMRIRPVSHMKRVERKTWPRGRPSFTHFVMYKENCDTGTAINMIGRMLNIKPGSFNYAGTKDKRGKTSQMVSIKRVNAERLVQLNKGLKNISCGNFAYKDNVLKLGHLAGNRFTIILREIDLSDGKDVDVISGLTSITNKGFINYYGMQRFGTTEIPTHEIGRALIRGEYKEAIDLILKPRTGENGDMQQCRKIWSETNNASKALKALWNKDCIEGQLLQGINNHKPNDFVNALNKIPRNTRLMYIHSYQSFLFNSVTSKRISIYGLNPVVGDLYVLSQKEDSTPDSVVGDKLKLEADEKPKIVTQDDIDNKKVSIYDIVLPLPGTNIIYPENDAIEWFKEILSKDGLDLNSFNSKVIIYSLSGSYRHILVKPKNLTWSIVKYHDRDEDLCLGDWDILNGKTLNLDKSGDLQAVKVTFDLPSSSYATMAIREVTKKDTSIWAQKFG